LIFCPFRASFKMFLFPFHRAAPYAFLFCPFRAENENSKFLIHYSMF
jgi:hypothetical protein